MTDASPGEALRVRALEALGEVIDPELGLDVVELGLVYSVDVCGRDLHVDLTMTSPACPLGDVIARDAETRLRALDGVDDVEVRLVWDPPWTPERMSQSARAALGWSR